MKLELTESRELFESFQDENGWITKTIEEIAEETEEDAAERIDLISSLNTCHNFYEMEFKDESETSWRFTEEA